MYKDSDPGRDLKHTANFLKNIKKILPHLTIIIAVMFIVMLITDIFNNAIQMLVGPYFKTLLTLFCIVSIITALMYIVQNWNNK